MSPESLYLFAGVGIGAVIGVMIGAILFKRTAGGIDESRLALETERAALQARLAAAEEKARDAIEHANGREAYAGSLNLQITQLNADKAALEMRLEKEMESAAEKLAVINDARQKLADTFTALSKQALDQNNQTFTAHAEQVLKRFQEGAQADLQKRQEKIAEIVTPVKDSLERVDVRIREIEQARTEAYTALREQVTNMAVGHQRLNDTATHLVSVLKNTKSRGQWGEIQLRRVVEIAGMTQYCDFSEQVSVVGGDARLRPDMTIRLPSQRTIVVDAKAPMDAFLDAHEAADEDARRRCMARHASSLRGHVGQLSKKQYWESFKPSPEFVLLFLPNEAIYSTALDHDPKLIEDAATSNVIIATPATLIALLKATAYGWRQEAISKEVQEGGKLGRELYERLVKMTDHITKLGDHLAKSVNSYNDMIGSIERRVLITGRKFKEMDVVGDNPAEIAEPKEIDLTIRSLQARDADLN